MTWSDRVRELERVAQELMRGKVPPDRTMEEAQQLLRIGVCPCVVLGRYSTCCGAKEKET